MADDYYQLLGVSKNASEEEIQKAYRKQARKYHPDLHVDKDDKEKKKVTQKFQQIQQAYDVLSDKKKRQMYDQYGPQFEQMAGAGGSPFGGGGGGLVGGGGSLSGGAVGGGGGLAAGGGAGGRAVGGVSGGRTPWGVGVPTGGSGIIGSTGHPVVFDSYRSNSGLGQ